MLNIKPTNKSSSNRGHNYVGDQNSNGLASATTSLRPKLEQDARGQFPISLPTNRKITYETAATRSTPIISSGLLAAGGNANLHQPGQTLGGQRLNEQDDDFTIVTTQEFDEDNFDLRLCKAEGSMRSTDDSLHPPEVQQTLGRVEYNMQSEILIKPKRLYLPAEIPSGPKLRPKKPIDGLMNIEETLVSPDAVYSTPPKKSKAPIFFGKPREDGELTNQRQQVAEGDASQAKGTLASAEINKKTCMELRTGLIKHSSEYLDIMLSEEF